MSASPFRRRLAAAIASRQALDTPHWAQRAIEADDVAFWQAQVQLERAIPAWKHHSVTTPRTRSVIRRVAAPVMAMSLAVAAAWISHPVESVVPLAPPEPVVAMVPVGDVLISKPADPLPAILPPVVARRPAPDNRLAEATVTAERLAYAFQPVGEQVGSVVRLLIDAVPGADVFAL